MTGRLGNVEKVVRGVKGGVPIVQVEVELGDELLTAEHLDSPGVDAPPLPGDEVMVAESEGEGETYVAGYADPKNPSLAADGEYRAYARDAEGNIKVTVWLKADGTGTIFNESGKFTLLPDGSFSYNDGAFTVDVNGNAKFAGEVTAMVGTPEAPLPGVTLSKHLHPTGVGPSGAPTPGS